MPYELILLEEFVVWLEELDEKPRLRILSHLELLVERGPLLGRPYADTLKGSKISNLKELRVQYRGEPIRILFAFDQKQQAVIILGGCKRADKRWYEVNVPIAEELFARHVEKQRKPVEDAMREEKEN
jgi:hypothetical protein